MGRRCIAGRPPWRARGARSAPSRSCPAGATGPATSRPTAAGTAAPTTFLTKRDARAWLALRQADIVRQAWEPPETAAAKTKAALTFASYAETWLAQRDLKQRTREHYRKLLDAHLLPKFGALPLASISADDVRGWYSRFGSSRPTLRAHRYGFLRTVMSTAVSDGKIA